jgi:hypothetical protein
VLDLKWLMSIPLYWEADPSRRMWLKTVTDVGEVSLRINAFPDEPMYSIEVDDDVFVDLEELPPTWTEGPWEWPETAKPRWENPSGGWPDPEQGAAVVGIRRRWWCRWVPGQARRRR